MAENQAPPPPSYRDGLIDPTADTRPPIARAHDSFKAIDRLFGLLGGTLQEIETERAQLTWALIQMVRQAGGQVVITKGEQQSLPANLGVNSEETELGIRFYLVEGGNDVSDRFARGGDRRTTQ